MTESSVERTTLDQGVDRLRPLLEGRGFTYSAGDEAASSGGRFAAGSFRRGTLEIGLIVRDRVALGCPNYSTGHGYAGHDDVIQALGADGRQQLVAGEGLAFRARGGGDSFEALRQDLERIILPALDDSEDRFLASLQRACERVRAGLGLPPPPG
jgi:hypothetical protein